MKALFLVVLTSAMIVASSNAQQDGIIHFFDNTIDSEGSNPTALIQSGSTLLGVTSSGGTGGGGTLFRLNPDGSGFLTLRSFSRDSVNEPSSLVDLIQAGTLLYGTSHGGGSANKGTLFSMNLDGTGLTLLHSFNDGFDFNRGGVSLSGDRLYGMTSTGGGSGLGTIYSINANGTGFAVLHTFSGGSTDGATPLGGLTIIGSKAYGMTNAGGASGVGTLFSINTDGTGFSILHHFSNAPTDGKNPMFCTLVNSGTKLFGTTHAGGNFTGTVFSIETDGAGFSLLNRNYSLGDSFADETLSLVDSRIYGGTQRSIFRMNLDGSDFALIANLNNSSFRQSNPKSFIVSPDQRTITYAASISATFDGAIFSIPTKVPEANGTFFLTVGATLLLTVAHGRRTSKRPTAA